MRIAAIIVFAFGLIIGLVLPALPHSPQPQAAAGPAAVKLLGTVKSVSVNSIYLSSDDGAQTNVLVQDSTRIVRIAPGQKDLHDAAPISIKDLQPGDRVLVRGNPAAANQISAVTIVCMKHSDIEGRQQREREDWQKRGIGGLVRSVDEPSGTITASVGSAAAQKTVAIRVNKDTVIRRYAPDSVRFDDAKPGTLAEIKPGDQVRARGTRNADGAEFSAEEVVSGTFRNFAGILDSVDATSGTITVVDSATKKPLSVKLTADSQLRSLPPEMAQHLAQRMSGGTPGAGGPNASLRPPTAAGTSQVPVGAQRRGDIQQMFNRLPVLSVADMHKGDAVMLVTTEGTGSGAVTAIKLLDGVAPLLAATNNGSGEITLSPWSLGGQGGEDAEQ